jgi:ketosteroid isomerase-like protein
MPSIRSWQRAALLAWLGLDLGATATGATPTPQDEIRRLEAEANAAYAANDLPKYFSYYADDLRAMYPDGPTTLPEYKKSWTAFIQGGGAILRFTYTDLQIQVSPSGDAVVATYRASVRTRNPGKDPVDENYLETDVFFKRGADWKIVEVHYSPFQPPGKP